MFCLLWSLTMSENWRVDSHDREIKQLQKDLSKAEDKIWELEIRPLKWLLVVAWLALIITVTAEIAHKH